MSVEFKSKMIIEILVIFGCIISLSHEAAVISLPASGFNDSYDLNSPTKILTKRNCHENFCSSDYLKLPPGATIYFYRMKNENFILGHKLQSDEEVDICFVNANRNYRQIESQFVGHGPQDVSSYVVLKTGILVPQTKRPSAKTNRKCLNYTRNLCVYQSLKPIYYVRGFKDILIPADALYSKSILNEIVNTKNTRTNEKADIADLSKEKERPSIWTDASSYNEFPFFRPGIEETENEVEEEIFPDKTCSGEVTLFLLKSDGVFKRITADPYMPVGLHLAYSLLDNLILQPKFLGGSALDVFYVTGENGDLVPHPENSHKITAESGGSVLFMLSKNGALFPVREEQKRNELIRYYFDGKLVHETRQYLDTYSNSTTVLINRKKFTILNGNGPKSSDVWNPRSELFQEFRVPKTKFNQSSLDVRHHRLRKREAYLSGCERSSVAHSQPALESHSGVRHMSAEPSRLVDYSRNHGYFMRKQQPSASDQEISAHCNNPSAEYRYSDVGDDLNQGPSLKSLSPSYEGIRKAGPNVRAAIYSEAATDPIEQEQEMNEMITPSWDRSLLRPRTDIFIFDEKGTRIRLIPEITDSNDVVIYKLTCKGNLVRYPSCKEPEFGFEINFQLLLDEFVLVPTVTVNKPFSITYVLQENGDLVPAEDNANTFRKAPGSLIYYMLGKNNILFPVQQVIDMDGNVSFFYQDFFLLKMKDTVEKPLHFTTKGSPLFAFFNGLTMISMSSRPRLKSRFGSNWNQLKPSEPIVSLPKTMFLTGPKGELMRVAPYKNRQGSTVVYELDCNGILYRSPKDKKKCIILKSYILLKEGILLPSNDTNGYVYMMSKNGDLFPYLYPDGKIEAPLASSLKYVLCEKGILLPIKLEIVDNFICYIFRDAVVYKERVYCRTCLDRLNEKQLNNARKYKKSSCDVPINDNNNNNNSNNSNFNESGIKLFVNKNGDFVFYKKQNKILKRHPPESVPSYLKYTMGSFEVQADGSLYQIRYQDPCENVANLMLEPNGDLLEDTRNVNNVRSEYYVLDAKGNLIAVEARKTKKSIHFYRGLRRVCKVSLPYEETIKVAEISSSQEENKTPLGKDPLKLMEDPFPDLKSESGSSSGSDTRSLYIPIPLKSVSVSNTGEACQDCGDSEHKKKCDMLKDTLKQVSKGNSLPLALELELTDDIIEELKNWAAKCDKVLGRREANVDAYLNVINGLQRTKTEKTR